MPYIEKDKSGDYFNPASETVEINPKEKEGTDLATQVDENAARWAWLVKGWSDMTFKEKMSIFMPYMHYVNLRDVKYGTYDEALQNEIIDNAYELCRLYTGKFKFDPDGQGQPNLIIEFAPINLDSIPDTAVKADIKSWGEAMGMFMSKPTLTEYTCNCTSKE